MLLVAAAQQAERKRGCMNFRARDMKTGGVPSTGPSTLVSAFCLSSTAAPPRGEERGGGWGCPCMSSGASGRIPLLFLRSRRRITPLSGSPPVAFASTARGCAGMMTEDLRVYYSHTDPCSHLRWTARECHQFMYDRPWHLVSDFYAAAVCGRSSLRSLFPEDPIPSAGAAKRISGVGTDERGDETDPASADFAAGTGRRGRWARSTFKIDLGYHGGSFDGWQKQPGLNTVQGVMETALGEFVDEKKAQRLKDNSLPVNGCALVAGRTDKGVSALRQVCSFYTWNESVKAGDIKDAINSAAPGKLRALSVSEVSRVFHPNFSAKWRQYLYIFPLLPSEINNLERSDCDNPSKVAHKCARLFAKFSPENFREFSVSEEGDNDVSPKNYCFSVSKVNQLLIQLEGKSLSYKMFARDTKASRSTGPPTECYVFRARAAECQLPCDDEDGNGLRVMCVELVANRFLRRMVRVLVATSIREAAAGASDDSLLNLMDATCRRSTAPPAPPDGLCLANVGYDEFSKDCCLIP